MTDVTKDQIHDVAQLSAADQHVLRELTKQGRAGGLQLTGEDGRLGRLTKIVIEDALEGELDDHLRCERTDQAGRNGGNSHNGHRAETPLTDTGSAEMSVPRDQELPTYLGWSADGRVRSWTPAFICR